jgi:hypothetical protein
MYVPERIDLIMTKKIISNDSFDIIMAKCRIDNVLLSKITKIHTSTISRYRNDERNIGKQSFYKIYDALIELKVSKRTMKELRQEYEDSWNKKVL